MVSSISRIRLLSSDSILPRPPKTISFQENIAGGFYKHNTVGYKSFCNILYLEMMLMTLPLRLYHPRPLPYHHLLKFLVEDLTPHPCMKIARYIGIINVITAFYFVCQIREAKTYLKLSTSRLKLVLSFSAISSLLSICSLALLSLSRSRSISAFSLRDCSRSCSTANKSYLR